MRKFSWELKLSLCLIAATILIYTVKFLVIGDDGTSNTATYIFNALGFLPINVLLVTLILNSLLSMRAKKEQQEKIYKSSGGTYVGGGRGFGGGGSFGGGFGGGSFGGGGAGSRF